MSINPNPNPSDVIEVNSDTWKIDHNFVHYLDKKLRFANSPCVFHLDEHNFDEANGRCCVVLTVLPKMDCPLSYTIEYKAHNAGNGSRIEGKFTQITVASRPLYCDGRFRVFSLELKLTNVDIASVGESFTPVRGDLKSYIDRGPTVRLVGSDGNVLGNVPKRILELRSKTLEAMFGHEFKESRTGEIELGDFDVKTLEAFVHFLMTGEIIYGEETALRLVLLADKYDIQAMKSAAENFVKKNLKRMNEEDVIDIFAKVSRKSLYGAMVDSWCKE